MRSLCRTMPARSSAGSARGELVEVTGGPELGGHGHREEHHHCVVIDAEGSRLLSRRVPNDETAPLALVSDVLAISEEVLWAVDLNHGGASLLIALLAGQEQPAAYLTGLAVDRASGTYRGEAKTDARDASVIADQAPMRRDLGAGRDGQPGPAEVLRGDRRAARGLPRGRTGALERANHPGATLLPSLISFRRCASPCRPAPQRFTVHAP